MIKSELVQRVATQNPHLYQRDVENIVNAILGEIIAAMAVTAKPYFGDVTEMTYLQWLQRYVELAIGAGDLKHTATLAVKAEPWLLLRASGTEHMLRLYAEAASPRLVGDILEAAESFANAG